MTIDSVLPELQVVDSLPPEQLVAALAHLLALQARVVSRLAITPQAPADTGPRYVTQEDAAATLGIALSYVRRLTRTGRVPSLRRGKARLVRVGEVATYLDTIRTRPLARPVLRGVTSRP